MPHFHGPGQGLSLVWLPEAGSSPIVSGGRRSFTCIYKGSNHTSAGCSNHSDARCSDHSGELDVQIAQVLDVQITQLLDVQITQVNSMFKSHRCLMFRSLRCSIFDSLRCSIEYTGARCSNHTGDRQQHTEGLTMLIETIYTLHVLAYLPLLWLWAQARVAHVCLLIATA